MSKHQKHHTDSSEVQTQSRQQQAEAAGRDAGVKPNSTAQPDGQSSQRGQQAQQAPGREAGGSAKAEGKQRAQQPQPSPGSMQDKSKRGVETPTRGNPTNSSDGNEEDSTLEGRTENQGQAVVNKSQPGQSSQQKRDKGDEGCGCGGTADQPR